MKKIKDIIIVSPSKNRTNCTIQKVLGDSVQLFVEPQDKNKYQTDNNTKNLKIEVIDKNDKGFGYVLSKITDHYLKHNIRYVLFADDDIYGLKTKKGNKLKNINKFLEEGLEILQENNYAQLMVSFSGHNWYTPDKIKEYVGCWGMVFLDLKKIKEVGGYDTDLFIFNDWDISARLIRHGHKTACWYDYKFEHKMKSKKGGAFELYENNDFMLEQCKKMMAKHGPTIKIIWSKTHKQYEIRFLWKKVKALQGVSVRTGEGIGQFLKSNKGKK
jgi:mRNA-degrading endonuclease HigB of HigAB toxin-antitoxin module